MSTRWSLRGSCDHACIFCGVDAASVGDEQPTPGSAGVTIVGLEPTASDALEDVVARASEHGEVSLQTHGARLPQERLLTLAGLGLRRLELSLHGTSEAHDFVVGTAGSYERVVRVARDAVSAGIQVDVVSVLTRSTYRTLSALAATLASLRVTHWEVAFPVLSGSAVANFDRVVPRVALAIPYALHALVGARRAGIEVSVAGAPLCLLGPHAALAVGRGPEPAFEGEPCLGCAARDACAGVSPLYAARFGVGELRALDERVVVELSRFAGVGPVESPELDGALEREKGQRHLRVL